MPSYKCDGINCSKRHELVKSLGCPSPTHGGGECAHVSKRDKNYAAELAVLNHDYETDIAEIAARARDAIVVPFCDRNGVRFDSGMGAYAFFDKEDKEKCCEWEYGLQYNTCNPWDMAPEGYQRVHELLNTEVSHASLLFQYMEDYNGQNP